MTNSAPQRRRRTRPDVEPADYLPPTDDFDDFEDPAVTSMSRQRRRQEERRRARRGPAKEIIVDAIEYEAVVVRLVDVKYEVVPPRTDRMLALARKASGDTDADGIDQLNEWIYDAFGDDVGDEVIDRIEDPKDKLGYDEIQKLMRDLMAYVTKNPTT